jgi:hypothetical protein
VGDVPRKSDEIRRLHAEGKSISQIASTLGIRYQHAYGVLKRSANKSQSITPISGLLPESEDILERILRVGFRHAGHWEIQEQKLNFLLVDKPKENNVLYAFICDKELLYVGKTVRTLKGRMQNYRTPGPTQKTSLRNHAKIKQLAETGKIVEIFFFPDTGLLHYGGFPINLAAALEDSLISIFSPPWNLSGKSKRY